MDDNFILAKKVKEFILTMEPLLENIPKKDLYNRDQIREELLSILKNIYNANLIKTDKERTYRLTEINKITRGWIKANE